MKNGSAKIINMEYNGNEIFLEHLNTNDIFGTNISGTNNENYEIIANEYTEIVVIDYEKILNPKNISHNYFNIFIRNLFDITNEKTRAKNDRMRVLEQKQIRNKLLEYFEIRQKKNRLNYIYLPFSFKDLADYLAVNRSAMFREIKYLKEERLIEIKGRKITLLYK